MSRYHMSVEINDTMYNKFFEDVESMRNISYRFPEKGRWDFCYGHDHACGFFFQFFPLDVDAEDYMEDIGLNPNYEECIDCDSMFDGLNGVQLALMLDIFDGNKDHSYRASLDLDF